VRVFSNRARLLAATLAFASAQAIADFRTFAIEQVYSNADGTVQFVVLHEAQGLANGHDWNGRTLASTRAGNTKTFTFAHDLPSTATAGKRVLVGSEGLAALGLIAPDYVMPNGFLATGAATLDFAGTDQVTYSVLPGNGADAIDRSGAMRPNLAANFAGDTATLPALPVTAVEFRNAGLDHYFISDLAPDLDALDNGSIPGWVRTGQSFKVYPISSAFMRTPSRSVVKSAFTCGDNNGNVTAMQTAIGARPGRINVYLVGLVDGSISRGNACIVGGGFAAIAAGAGAELLAHELGHDFALEHIDDLVADFNQGNVMHSASNIRQYLTEGQTVRAHLRPNSAINQVYALRPGLPTRNCDRDTLTLDCPAIRKRLWADGALPPI
jgi:hypothetical protein